MVFAGYEILRQLAERAKFVDPTRQPTFQFDPTTGSKIPGEVQSDPTRDEDFYQALKECAQDAFVLPAEPHQVVDPCRIVYKTRNFYPALLPIVGPCPVEPAPTKPTIVLVEVMGGESLNRQQLNAVRDFIEEEYGRVYLNWKDRRDVCEDLPTGPGYPPAPGPGPEPPPSPAPNGPDNGPVKKGPDVATEEASSFIALVAIAAGVYLILKRS